MCCRVGAPTGQQRACVDLKAKHRDAGSLLLQELVHVSSRNFTAVMPANCSARRAANNSVANLTATSLKQMADAATDAAARSAIASAAAAAAALPRSDPLSDALAAHEKVHQPHCSGLVPYYIMLTICARASDHYY
jgi:hypothetical protein